MDTAPPLHRYNFELFSTEYEHFSMFGKMHEKIEA
jgi:hypothetical protein